MGLFGVLCRSRIHISSFTLGAAGLLCLLLFLLPRSPSTQPVGFSLTLDLDDAEGDQAVSSLDLLPDEPFSIQVFGADIQGTTRISARLRFDASQVAYEGIDPGDALPNAHAVAQHDSSSVRIGVSSLTGSAAMNRGWLGTVRFRTTAAFSDTEIWLVDAELARSAQTETISPAVGVALQVAPPPSPDFDGDGVVGFSDFVAFAGIFGAQRGDGRYVAAYDLNNDGGIGFEDFVVFAGSFGEEANRAPAFTVSPPVTRSLAENTPSGQAIGDPVTATDADGNSLTYRLRGVHADRFSIGAGTGQLLTRDGVAYDHEASDTYSVTVRVSDGKGGRATLAVGIHVTDVDEPPGAPPEGVAVTPRNNALLVSWNAAPDEAGKPPVSGYEVTHRRGDAGDWQEGMMLNSRADTGVTLAGLTNEQAYHVRVRTVNDEGASPWSAPVAGAPTAGPRPRGVFGDLEVNVDSDVQVNLASLFTRPALGTLTYGATSSDEGVATVTVTDTLAVVRGVAAGRATLTATAGDVHGNSAQTTFTVIVTTTSPPGPGGPFVPPPQAPANNRPPSFDDGISTSRTVAENTPARRPIQHPVRATDPDGHQVTYRLSGPDSASFSVDTDSGQLRTLSGITYDFEDNDRYSIILEGSDPFGESATIGVTVHVSDVDEPPEIPVAPVVQPASTTNLAVTWDAPDNTGPDITDYDVQYRKSGSFLPHSHDGPGTSATILDLDVNTQYEVQVRATNDEGTSQYSRSGFGTTSSNLPPVFDEGTSATREVAENTTGVQDLGAPLRADDPEGTSVTYSLSHGDTESFDIDTNTGQLQTVDGVNYDFETKDRYTVTVQAQDEQDGRATISVTIDVTDDDSEDPEAPGKPTVTAQTLNSLSIRWTAPVNTGPAVNDYDVQYSEDGGAFTDWPHTGPGTTTTITSLTADTPYRVQVLARSPEGESSWSESADARTVANRAPTFNEGTSTTRTLAENSTGTSDIGNPLTARDTDGGTLSYDLEGTDRDAFALDGAQLQTLSGQTYDFEAKPRYEVTVRVEDGQGGSNTIEVTINLTDLQEKPGRPDAPGVSAASSTSLEVTWDEPANTGPDINDFDVQYRQGDSGGFTSWTHNSAERSATITGRTPGTSYQVQVLARSPEGASDWSEPGTGSTDANGLPVFTDGGSATRALDENTTGVNDIGDPVSATDAEKTTLTYALEGTHADSFSIDTRNGQLKTRTGRNYDYEVLSRYSVNVKATDGHGGERSIPVSIDLNDLNEAPVFTSGTAFEAAENQSFAGSVTAADLDGADNNTDYTLTGGSERARLEISNAGALTFRDDPDFESPVDAGSNNSYVVEVTATGGAGGRAQTAAQTVTVTVTDENEPPHFTSVDTFMVVENVLLAGRLAAQDVDRDDSITGYAVTGGADQDDFEIKNTRELHFRDDPDYERPADAGGDNEYTVQVEVTGGADTRALATTQTITVAIDDEDEPPGKPDPPVVSDTTESSLTVRWDEPTNTGPDITNYLLQYRDTGSFTGSPDSSTTRNRTLLNLHAGRTYQFQVQAKNDEGKGSWSNTGSGATLTAPTVSSVAFTSTPASGQNNTYKKDDVIDVTAAFSEAVTVSGTPELDLTIGATVRKAGYQSGMTTTKLLFQYTVADTDEDTNGATINENGLKLNGGTIVRSNSTINAYLAHAARANQSSHKVDGKAPDLSEAEVNGNRLTLTYEEVLDSGSRPATGDFAVTVNDTARNVSTVAVSSSNVSLNLASAVSFSQAISLAYTPGTNPIRDKARNPAIGLSNLAVTNRTQDLMLNFCSITAQVRDAIVAASGVSACGDVTLDHLSAISRLSLDRENISTLKAGDFAGLTSLVSLDLEANSLTMLPANIFSDLSALKELKLNKNDLASLDANAFSGLSALEHLDLSRNDLASLDANAFSSLSALEHLDLSRNSLASLDANAFSGLSALEHLDLSRNGRISLDANAFSELTALRVLNLNTTTITSLPATVFSSLSALEHLDIGNIRIASLPASVFSGLTELEFLDVSNTRITNLPATVFSSLSALDTLILRRNEIGSLDAGQFSALKALTHLDLASMDLASVSGNLFSGLTELEFLDLSANNDLTTLPDTVFSGLAELRTLDLASNGFSTLPGGLFSGLTALTTILLRWNTVDPLPITVSLGSAGTDQFVAKAHTGAPFDMVLPLRVYNGGIDSGEESITIPQGSVESEPLSVSPTAGTRAAVTVDLVALPALPASDSGYELVRSGDLPLVVIDAEPGVEIYPTELTMPEDDSDTYTVVLTMRPTADVTVTVTVPSGADVTVNPSPLAFTADNWDTPQTVTVSSSADTDSDDDEVTLTHAVSGGYQGVTADDVEVTVTETAVSTNSPPSIFQNSHHVRENFTAAIFIVATDADERDYVTGYEITGGRDRALFEITARGSEGELTFVDIPDYERPAGSSNRHEIVVTVTSGMGARKRTGQQQIAITVTDVDEPPGRPPAPGLSLPGGFAPTIVVSQARITPVNTGPDINAWGIRYRAKDSGDFIDQTPHTSLEFLPRIDNLDKGFTYEVQVQAKNDEGDSEWSLSAEIEIPNEPPVAVGSFDDLTRAVGGAVEIVSARGMFARQDGDLLTYTATSSNTSAASVQMIGTQVLVDPGSAGSATITVTASDPYGASDSESFDVTLQAPSLSAPTLSINANLFTLAFTDDFAANETRSYQVRIRHKTNIGPWATGCHTETNDEASQQSISVTLQGAVSDFFEPGTAYEADYGYLGASCGGSLTGVRSAAAEVTTSGTASFDIDFVFVGRISSTYRSLIEAAAERWEQIITGDIPNHRLSSGQRNALNGLFAGITAPEVVDDLVIYVKILDIDGAAGTGQSLLHRVPSVLPIASEIQFDRYWMNAYSDIGRERLILHEIGHALGFGTIPWKACRLLKNRSFGPSGTLIDPAPDTHFSGTKAVAAFDAAGGSSYTGNKVPVENSSPNAASRDSHWRESVMQSELMTPTGSAPAPLSAITIQSMADLGYTVDVTQADTYTLPATSKIAIGPEGQIPLNCVIEHTWTGPVQPEPIILNLRRVTESQSEE